jgi:hypothetical protein
MCMALVTGTANTYLTGYSLRLYDNDQRVNAV